jgi:hypothetical protein
LIDIFKEKEPKTKIWQDFKKKCLLEKVEIENGKFIGN